MKRILFLTFCIFYLSLSSQEIKTEFISKKLLDEAISKLEVFPNSEAKKELQRLANFSIQRTY